MGTRKRITTHAEAEEAGLSKNYIEQLYREPNWLSKKAMAKHLSQELNRTFTMHDVTILFSLYKIPLWSSTERGKAAKAKSSSSENTEVRARQIKEAGFSGEKLRALFEDEKLTRAAITRKVNEAAGEELLTKKWVNRIFAYYEIEVEKEKKKGLTRREALDFRATLKGLPLEERLTRAKVSREEIIECFDKGETVSVMAQRWGLYDNDVRQVLKASKRVDSQKKALPRVTTIFNEGLAPRGWDANRLKREYCSYNLSLPEVRSRIVEELGEEAVSLRQLERIMKHLGIKKTPEQIKEKQGRKSREEKAQNLKRLADIGHTPESAAAYYEDSKTLTWYALVDEFNELLGDKENPFTEKWLVKTLEPHFSEDFKKLRGVSRAENNFGEWLRSVYTGPVEQGVYKIIPKYQVDFYLFEEKIAIEFNGDYWHSDRFLIPNHGMTAEAYHGLKSDLAKEAGLTMIFVWESDWYYRREEVETAISLLLTDHIVSSIIDRRS